MQILPVGNLVSPAQVGLLAVWTLGLCSLVQSHIESKTIRLNIIKKASNLHTTCDGVLITVHSYVARDPAQCRLEKDMPIR